MAIFRRFIFAVIVLTLGLMPVENVYALINAKPVYGYPDLVRLVFQDGTMCTGTYINDTSILTAAHCLMKKDGETIHKVEKILSASDRVLPVEHQDNILHPKFNLSWWPSFDVGIVKTSKNTDFQANFKVSDSQLSWWGRAKLFGCGISEFSPKIRSRSYGENGFIRD